MKANLGIPMPGHPTRRLSRSSRRRPRVTAHFRRCALVASFPKYILNYMKQILVEIDDRCARDLARVAPAGRRVRAEFIRLALRRAVDLALDRVTEAAYRARPLNEQLTPADLVGWDDCNALVEHAAPPRKARARRGAKTRAA